MRILFDLRLSDLALGILILLGTIASWLVLILSPAACVYTSMFELVTNEWVSVLFAVLGPFVVYGLLRGAILERNKFIKDEERKNSNA